MSSLERQAFAGLERSCSASGDAVVSGPSSPGLDRIEARFGGSAFAPHRHDTYALGITLGGVQSFRYRGVIRHSLPGEIIVLHPDEVHDGGAGTDEGLVYRMLYLEPDLVTRAIGGSPARLPFAGQPVIRDDAFRTALLRALNPIDEPLDALLLDGVLVGIVDGLRRHAGEPVATTTTVSTRAVHSAREYLVANAIRSVGSQELEAVTGLDRFSLARQFRAAFGTSPHRFLLMRRLQSARSRIEAGESLADVAFVSGFADQSHLTRHFKKAYGVSPGRWATLVAAGRNISTRQAASGRARRLST